MITQQGVRKRPWRNGGGFAFVLMLVVAGTFAPACSAGGTGTGRPGVASLPGHTASAQQGQSLTEAGSDQDMVNFTRCMRSHGVQMSDPFHRPGNTGLTLDMPTQDAATQAAYNACTHFIAKIIQAKQAGAAAESASQLAALTRYARCMRSHDIAMLDPTSSGQLDLGNVPGITNSYGRYSPQFRAADAACRHLLPAAVNDDGTGP